MRGRAHRKRGFTVSLGLMVVVMLVVGVSSAAGDPKSGRIVRETLTATNLPDAVLSATCGVPVTYSYVYERTTMYFEEPYDASSRRQVIGHYRGTITGPGGILLNRENFRILVNPDEGTTTYTGLPIRVLVPSGRTLIRDVGFIKFDENFNVLVVHGPHPVATGQADLSVACPYLT